ncbi:MAG: hypothetical protein LH481_17845 [Burkholderiales bacterium]|nr:hypothetical protein [Burkholderiales bacterium]
MNENRRYDHTWVAHGACVIRGIFFGLSMAHAAEPALKPAASDKDLVLNGDARCTKCHDEGDAFPVLAIGKTPHGTKADKRTPSCVSCHGESDRHINKPEGVKDRTACHSFTRITARSSNWWISA